MKGLVLRAIGVDNPLNWGGRVDWERGKSGKNGSVRHRPASARVRSKSQPKKAARSKPGCVRDAASFGSAISRVGALPVLTLGGTTVVDLVAPAKVL